MTETTKNKKETKNTEAKAMKANIAKLMKDAAKRDIEKRMQTWNNRYADEAWGDDAGSGLYEITCQVMDTGQIRKMVLEADNGAEARELFESIPAAACCKILETKRIINNFYWADEA